MRHSIVVLFLLLFDLIAYYSSLTAAYTTRKLLGILSPDLTALTLSFPYFLNLWGVPCVFLSFIAYERLYFKKIPFWDETRHLMFAVTVSSIAVLAVVTLGKTATEISRLTVVLLWSYGLLLFPLYRLAGKRILFKAGLWKENMIILGAGAAGIEAAKGILSEIHMGYHLIGFLDDTDDKIGTEIRIHGKAFKVFGKTRHFRKFVNLLNVSTVVIAVPSLSVDKLAALTNNIQKHTKNIILIPDIKGVALTNTELHHLFVQKLFLLKINNNLKSPYNRFVKRTFDAMVSLFFLPLLLPLIGIFGILIKLNSPGPVFYKHARVGRHGRQFLVYKFRSMYNDSEDRLAKVLESGRGTRQEWDTFYKLKNDPRITTMGKFLRRTSLDELPQIFNVLKGEMSLVGPRPVLRKELTKYYKEYEDYYNLVRPGITGLWQVSGRNGVTYDGRVRLDTWYVLNWSVWLDMVILFRTINVVLKKEGVY